MTCLLSAGSGLVHLHELIYDESIADFVIAFVEAVLAAGLFVVACFYIFKRTDLAIARRLVPLYLWTALAAVVACYGYSINRIKSVPNFLRTTTGHFGFEEFSLKKDGRYIYQNTSFLSSSYNYGTYSQRDSVIILLPGSLRNAPQELQLIIRPYHISSPIAFNKQSLVFGINKNGVPRKFDSGYQGHRIVELANN